MQPKCRSLWATQSGTGWGPEACRGRRPVNKHLQGCREPLARSCLKMCPPKKKLSFIDNLNLGQKSWKLLLQMKPVLLLLQKYIVVFRLPDDKNKESDSIGRAVNFLFLQLSCEAKLPISVSATLRETNCVWQNSKAVFFFSFFSPFLNRFLYTRMRTQFCDSSPHFQYISLPLISVTQLLLDGCLRPGSQLLYINSPTRGDGGDENGERCV